MFGIPGFVTGNELEGLTEWQSNPCFGFTGVTIYKGGATNTQDAPREHAAFAVFRFENGLCKSVCFRAVSCLALRPADGREFELSVPIFVVTVYSCCKDLHQA